ncbi:hypothetical protein CTRI78_v008269 [Colletotrichum trifolii]|uniref:Uncharacterized protein n=1 Tax=Colletotrichum trifolii TaxID=5466 RepID=A0A4R8QXW0_COLTR|nr:hypothetical protein CTRI78_v008269 [Colletotrichum trifolii]
MTDRQRYLEEITEQKRLDEELRGQIRARIEADRVERNTRDAREKMRRENNNGGTQRKKHFANSVNVLGGGALPRRGGLASHTRGGIAEGGERGREEDTSSDSKSLEDGVDDETEEDRLMQPKRQRQAAWQKQADWQRQWERHRQAERQRQAAPQWPAVPQSPAVSPMPGSDEDWRIVAKKDKREVAQQQRAQASNAWASRSGERGQMSEAQMRALGLLP